MAIYRGKYILQGLDEIPPEMERDLDLAYDLCKQLKDTSPCEMCGRCCHQPYITVRDTEVDRVAEAAGIDLYTFATEYRGDQTARSRDGGLRSHCHCQDWNLIVILVFMCRNVSFRINPLPLRRVWRPRPGSEP